MKKMILYGFAALFVLFNVRTLAQHYNYFAPDSLEEVTVSGKVIVDSTAMHLMYYMDTNSDAQADYFLHFGPFWYSPNSGDAVRPTAGDSITIKGGLHTNNSDYNVLVAYEIDGKYWRDPYEPLWDDMGNHDHNMMDNHQGSCTGYGFGFNHDSLETITVTGTTILDSTFLMEHYYLDENNDEVPEYQLNFGPFWYSPENGTVRPKAGDQIKIKGGMISNNSIPMLVVYEIDGSKWLDSNQINNHFGGGWFSKNISDSARFHSPFDNEDWIEMMPGWHGGGMHGGGMMADSLFGQILELDPHNVPNSDNENIIAAYEIGMYSPDSSNGMWQSGGCGGHMNFSSNMRFNFHFNSQQASNFNTENVQVKYWDETNNSWTKVNSMQYDKNIQSATFASSTANNFYIITSDDVTSVSDKNKVIPADFVLMQNYPNPFNPSTNIHFTLKQSSKVKVNIYNSLGEKINTLLNNTLAAGEHSITFNAENLPSGIYFYQLQTTNFNQTKKMLLLK